MVSGTVAGFLTIIWTRQAMSLEEARTRYEAILREVAARVAGEIQE